MKKLLLAAAAVLLPLLCDARDWDLSVRLDERTSYMQEGESGIVRSDFTNLDINGSLQNFSFRFRTRANKLVGGKEFLDATDIMYLDYRLGDWEFLAGKFQQEYGGYEYDANIIDLYYSGYYYDHYVGAFNWCANISRHFGNSKVTAQLAKSPLSSGFSDNLFAYNLGYKGTHGIWAPMWSVNLFDTAEGWKTAHLSLGNSFTMGPVNLQLDYITRTDPRDFRPFVDWSLASKLTYSFGDTIDIFAKINLDRNPSVADFFVPAGTDYRAWGGGIELYPIADRRNVRLHLVYCNNGVSNISAGITWKATMFRHSR